MSKYIDTRDLYKRQQELQSLKDAVDSAQEELDQLTTSKPDEDEGLKALEKWQAEVDQAEADNRRALEDFGDDEQTELAELDEIEGYVSDWKHGETMIPEDSFEDYARELADDLGSIPKDAGWPCTCIDWKKAANELKYDYSTVTYQGTDYLVRS